MNGFYIEQLFIETRYGPGFCGCPADLDGRWRVLGGVRRTLRKLTEPAVYQETLSSRPAYWECFQSRNWRNVVLDSDFDD